MEESVHRSGFEKPASEAPVGRLLSGFVRNFTLLMRQDALAKAEIFGKVGQLGSGADPHVDQSIHPLERPLSLGLRGFVRRRAQRRDRASDGARRHHRAAAANGAARCQDGGHTRRSSVVQLIFTRR